MPALEPASSSERGVAFVIDSYGEGGMTGEGNKAALRKKYGLCLSVLMKGVWSRSFDVAYISVTSNE